MHSIGHARTYMYGILKSAPKQVGVFVLSESVYARLRNVPTLLHGHQ